MVDKRIKVLRKKWTTLVEKYIIDDVHCDFVIYFIIQIEFITYSNIFSVSPEDRGEHNNLKFLSKDLKSIKGQFIVIITVPIINDES